MTTFVELGIPFPLYEAEANTAVEYRGLGTCLICHAESAHCFRPNALFVICSACDARNILKPPLWEPPRVEGDCHVCGARLPAGDGLACYDCVRAGRVVMGKDTELGVVGLSQAEAGVTHGLPGLKHPDFELIRTGEYGEGDKTPANEWIQARVPSEHLFELLRTPTYSSWQGERWLFHCGAPMIYLGEWESQQLTPGEPTTDIERHLASAISAIGLNSASFYVFRCPRCGKLRDHYDFN